MTVAIPPPSEGDAFVHEGADGWLFLRAGSNFVTSLYQREGGGLPDAKLALWRRQIEARAERCRKWGVANAHIIVPDKLTIYGDYQSAPMVDPDLAPAIRLDEQMRASGALAHYVDLVGPMRTQRTSAQLFWQTDTHWTPAGCHLAYLLLCERLGLDPEPDLLARPHHTYPAQLDLGWRLEPPRWEDVTRYDYLQKARRVWINRVTRYLEDPAYQEEFHVCARARFANASARNDRSVLLIGDSYSRPSVDALTAMLAETVRSVEFVWSSAVDWNFVRWLRPDILIVQTAERFLARAPDDRTPLWWSEWRQVARAQRRARERRRAAEAQD